jgi:cyclophilin family peptidyl-prolyl cis-trans isomerase
VLAQLQAEYPRDVKVVFRHYPLTTHDKATLAAQATEAAGLQGKFWEMHDALFAEQGSWAPLAADQWQAYLAETDQKVGLDGDQFAADLKSEAVARRVADARAAGEKIGLPYTPFLLINGEIWQGPTDYANLKTVADLLLLEKRQVTGCPAQVIDLNRQYTARLQTSKGEIVIRLLPQKAPVAVNSFVFLASQGWYDGVPFHRVIDGFMAQAGDPSGTGYGGPGYFFKNEINDIQFDRAGLVAMANSGADTNGSQFFITYAAQPHLDGKYTIFGEVIRGMDVANALTRRNPAQDAVLAEPDRIIKVTIEEQ